MPVTFEYTPPKRNAVVALKVAGEIAVEVGGKLLLEASRPDCPSETGEMRASGKAEPDGPLTVAVTYSRTSPDGYNIAARQHEDMSLHHPGGGSAKWLEKHMHSDGEMILEGMAEALRAGL